MFGIKAEPMGLLIPLDLNLDYILYSVNIEKGNISCI